VPRLGDFCNPPCSHSVPPGLLNDCPSSHGFVSVSRSVFRSGFHSLPSSSLCVFESLFSPPPPPLPSQNIAEMTSAPNVQASRLARISPPRSSKPPPLFSLRPLFTALESKFTHRSPSTMPFLSQFQHFPEDLSAQLFCYNDKVLMPYLSESLVPILISFPKPALTIFFPPSNRLSPVV